MSIGCVRRILSYLLTLTHIFTHALPFLHQPTIFLTTLPFCELPSSRFFSVPVWNGEKHGTRKNTLIHITHTALSTRLQTSGIALHGEIKVYICWI